MRMCTCKHAIKERMLAALNIWCFAEDDGDGMDILAAAAANSSDLDGALSGPGPSSPMRRTRAATRAAASQAPAAIAPAQPTQKRYVQ